MTEKIPPFRPSDILDFISQTGNHEPANPHILDIISETEEDSKTPVNEEVANTIMEEPKPETERMPLTPTDIRMQNSKFEFAKDTTEISTGEIFGKKAVEKKKKKRGYYSS